MWRATFQPVSSAALVIDTATAMVCDLEQRRIIHLLPDRDPATVEAWLAAHPEITVVSRDRGGGDGQAASNAAPQAVQVADRWHLMENASAAFLEAVRRLMRSIRDVLSATVISIRVVAEWATRRRRNEEAGLALSRTAPPARLLSRLLTTRRDHLSRSEAILVAAIETGVPALGGARDLTQRFHHMLRAGDAAALTPWLADANTSLFASFSKGTRNDLGAVGAALTEPWSNGQVFAKLKHLLRKEAARSKEAVSETVATLLDTYTPNECANYLQAAGYGPT